MNFYYFVVSFDSVNLTESAFTGYVLSGLSEIPGGIIVIPLLHFFGRRSVACVSFFLQAAAALITPFVRGLKFPNQILFTFCSTSYEFTKLFQSFVKLE